MSCPQRNTVGGASARYRVGAGSGTRYGDDEAGLGIGLALLVAGDVIVWGASGRSDITRALQIAELRDGLREGRAAMLDARLDIYSVNFGEASRHFEAAGAQCAPPMRG